MTKENEKVKQMNPKPGFVANEVPECKLQAAIAADMLDESSRLLLERETREMEQRLHRTGHEPGKGGKPGSLVGLALSGGGIRSATFCLGALQALAKGRWLKQVDYLSTVSGGGYIGSSLTWWLSDKPETPKGSEFGLSPDDFPYGEGSRAPLLRYVRQRGNWLAPGRGIDLFAGFAVVLRGVLLNLAVWIPILTGAMYLMYQRPAVLAFIDLQAVAQWVGLRRLTQMAVIAPTSTPNVYELLFWTAVLVAAVYVAACLVYSLVTGVVRGRLSSVPAIRWLLNRYRLRRFFEIVAGAALKVILVTLLFGLLPLVVIKLHSYVGVVGPGTVLAGLASTWWGFVRSRSEEQGAVPMGLIVTLAAGSLLFGILLIGQGIANWAHCTVLQTRYSLDEFYCANWGSADGSDPILFAWMFWGIFAFAVLLGLCVNLNYISLHRFYRDRMMETFMPSYAASVRNVTGPSPLADSARLSEMRPYEGGVAPFHLVNTNLVLVNSEQQRYRMRGGDSFVLTPLHCGSNATGWVETKNYMNDGMTLSTAMAISGAAANPNTGAAGGTRRNRFVALLMALVNVQLGYWVPHPTSTWFKTPNHFHPGLYHLTGWLVKHGFTEDAGFLQLSDGGHFDNLGLYELIRRRMRLIVLCDAGADPTFAYEDLVLAINRIDGDFGTKLEFHPSNPGTPVPASPLNELVAGKKPAFPQAKHLAERGYLLADIVYPGKGNEKGLLIMIKTTMVPGLPPEVLGYKATHPDFPDEATSDQFFDEAQFEAYREQGFHIATAMMNDPEVVQALKAAYGKWPA